MAITQYSIIARYSKGVLAAINMWGYGCGKSGILITAKSF